MKFRYRLQAASLDCGIAPTQVSGSIGIAHIGIVPCGFQQNSHSLVAPVASHHGAPILGHLPRRVLVKAETGGSIGRHLWRSLREIAVSGTAGIVASQQVGNEPAQPRVLQRNGHKRIVNPSGKQCGKVVAAVIGITCRFHRLGIASGLHYSGNLFRLRCPGIKSLFGVFHGNIRFLKFTLQS